MPLPLLPILAAALALFSTSVAAAPANLVANGSFEASQLKAGLPDHWAVAGNPAIHQQLLLDTGRDQRQCAKLQCTEFTGDGPDFHAMICQFGQISVRQGQWYRLAFWAKAEGIHSGAVEVGLNCTQPWRNVGLTDVFTPDQQWQPFELLFRAQQDLAAPASRLQFWFKGTGTLWLDDVVLTETSNEQQWFPQLATEGVKNFLPNSSFECGADNWGSYTYGLSGWAGNLYRLEGALDTTAAHHGSHSLKIALSPKTLPIYSFDYYEPVRQPVRRVLAANRGWVRVQPGEPLTLSAWLKADAEGIPAQLLINQAPDHPLRKPVMVGKDWQRHEFTFRPTQAFLFVAIGLDLEAAKRDVATLWIDEVQLERGEHATAYEPRHPVESFLETDTPGNIFTNSAAGLALTLRAFNNSDQAQTLKGDLGVTDFFERSASANACTLALPPRSGTNLVLAGLCQGQNGFFRATWKTAAETNSLRCAVITPIGKEVLDSPLGFNHAYPWDFLVQLARQAGIVWWRDWSAKWQTVEPAPGKWDFSVPDAQIQRVLGLDSQVEVLLPFPSASWSTTAKPDEVAKNAGNNSYLRSRLPVAYAPKDLNDFGHYAAAVARHYRQGQPRPVTYFQVLNEPVYTDYSLPRQFGYSLADYLKILETANRALHAADPSCQMVGGISANLEAGLTLDFVKQGGLRSLDVFDLHMYDTPRPAENYDEPFAALEALMRANGGPKPVWITEWGCYADDDPACQPQSVGDAAMNRCRWASERAATEHIVKFTAVSFAHGVRKIFFHAGTCGPINSPDAGGVLFEYGGAPRKMYAGVAALDRLLGVPESCVKHLKNNGLYAYVFRCQDHAVAIAWAKAAQSSQLKLSAGLQAYDVMGNRLAGTELPLTSSPVYLVSPQPEAIIRALTP